MVGRVRIPDIPPRYCPPAATTEEQTIRDMAQGIRAFYGDLRKMARSADMPLIPLVWHMYAEVRSCGGLVDARERYKLLRDTNWDADEQPLAHAGMRALEILGKKLVDTNNHRGV